MAGIEMKVDLVDLDPLLARLDVVPYKVDQEAGRAMADATDLLREAVRANTPIESGSLQMSLRAQSSVYFARIEGRVSTNKSYAPMVEEGHGEIVPRHDGMPRRAVLKFRTKGSGVTALYRPRVKAMPGVHMFRRGLEMAGGSIVDRFRAAMHAVGKEIAG
jgi:hypothetical protein